MQRDHQLQISYRAPASIRANRNNARSHSSKQVAQIAASISQFGFTNPVLVDEEGLLIAGHGRLKAAQKLDLPSVPAIELKGLSEAEKRALLLADNKIALNAGWDTDLLKVELEHLQQVDADFDVQVTGFSVGEIDVILEAVKIDPDDELVPAVSANPYVQLGDIYQLGDHRIGCGDCRNEQFLRLLVGNAEVDAAFLDPPYNVSITKHASTRDIHREFTMASGEMSGAEFEAFLKEGLSACASVTRNGGIHFVCMDWRHMDAVSTVGKTVYNKLLNLCIWNKSAAGMGSLYRSKHELVFVYRVGSAPHFNAIELGRHGRNRTNVWDYNSANSLRGNRRADLDLHPTVKPVAMIAEAMCDVTKQGDLVLDAFLGSGSSLIAAERVHRRLVGCEIDPGYVQLAIERWRDLTGDQPVRVAMRENANA
ncbi:MAG TPA: DNA methyltransferase [Rhizomicrobium sp.]|jgi:DNA modification methylase